MTASLWLMAIPVLVMVGAVHPAAADPVTFAQFSEQSNASGSNFVFTNNNVTGTLNTAHTTQGDAVFFSFDNTIAGLPADLMGQLSATLLINGRQGVTTSDALLFKYNALLDFAHAFSAVHGITRVSDNILTSFIANGSGTMNSDPPPEVPEPASLAMLAVGAVACAAGVFWRPGQVPA